MVTSNRPRMSFNPFSWGTLFFTFWLTLITIPEVWSGFRVIAWLFFSFSCVLLLATFIPPFDKYFGAEKTQRIILPWVFLTAFFVWIVSSLTALGKVPESLRIIVPIGMLTWSFAYMTIMLWSFKNKRKGAWTGFCASGLFIAIGIIRFFQAVHPVVPWTLIVIGAGLCLITIFRSKIGREFPLV